MKAQEHAAAHIDRLRLWCWPATKFYFSPNKYSTDYIVFVRNSFFFPFTLYLDLEQQRTTRSHNCTVAETRRYDTGAHLASKKVIVKSLYLFKNEQRVPVYQPETPGSLRPNLPLSLL